MHTEVIQGRDAAATMTGKCHPRVGQLKAAMFRISHSAKVAGGRPRICSTAGLTRCSAAVGSPRTVSVPLDEIGPQDIPTVHS